MTPLTSADLALLRRLRARFLQGDHGAGDYWRSEAELEVYDRWFAERIGWKWESVLGELSLRGWRPTGRHLLDWGCGTGIASRRVLEHWPEHFASLTLHDRSARAVAFASRHTPELPKHAEIQPPLLAESTVLVSHVLNEISAADLAALVALLAQAAEVIWVEAGTHAESRRLGAEVREPLRGRGFSAIAPCTHSRVCGMLTPANERHWCHSFARVPSAVFQDSAWHLFSRELGIDLRTLPYSFQVLQRLPAPDIAASRVIGEPRAYKGFLKLLSCQAEGVAELTLQKRDAGPLWKRLQAGENQPLYCWHRQGDRITAGEPAFAELVEPADD